MHGGTGGGGAGGFHPGEKDPLEVTFFKPGALYMDNDERQDFISNACVCWYPLAAFSV